MFNGRYVGVLRCALVLLAAEGWYRTQCSWKNLFTCFLIFFFLAESSFPFFIVAASYRMLRIFFAMSRTRCALLYCDAYFGEVAGLLTVSQNTNFLCTKI